MNKPDIFVQPCPKCGRKPSIKYAFIEHNGHLQCTCHIRCKPPLRSEHGHTWHRVEVTEPAFDNGPTRHVQNAQFRALEDAAMHWNKQALEYLITHGGSPWQEL